MHSRMIKNLAVSIALVSANLMLGTAPARALVVHLDTFTVVKNGATLFEDAFADGIAPPSAPSEFASYLFTRGIGAESGGLLELTPSTAPVGTSALGTPVQTARGTLATNVVPADLTNGLKSSPMTFSVTAVFGLVAPAAGEAYGVRLADRRPSDGTFTGTFGDDVVDLQVIRSAGTTAVRFRSSDFISHLADSTFEISLLPTVTADRIALTLARSDANSNVITASYALFDGLNPVGSAFAFTNTETIFSNQNWTRAEFLASIPAVPEPETYALMLTGIGIIGWQLRRKAKRAAGARLV